MANQIALAIPAQVKKTQPTGTFYDETYGVTVKIFCPASNDTIRKYLKEHYNTDENDDSPFSGKCVEIDSDDGHCESLIFLKEWELSPFWVSVLAHECFHATEQILRARDIKHSEKTSEAWAYLHDSIIRRSMKILGAKSKKPKQEKTKC